MTPSRLARSDRSLFKTGTMLVAAALVALLVWSAIDEVRFAGQRLGVNIGPQDGRMVISHVEPGLVAERAGIRPGDVVVRINGRATHGFSEFDAAVRDRPDETPLQLDLLRDDEPVEIQLQPGAPPDIARLLTQLILVAAYFGLGLLAATYRRQDLRARLLMIFVGLIALELAMPVGYVFPDWLALAQSLVWYLATGLQIGLELHLVSLIPGRLGVLRHRPGLVPLFYLIGLAAGAALGALAIGEWLGSGSTDSPRLLLASGIVLAAWAVSISAILLWQIVRAKDSRGRNQALLVLVGLMPWAAYILFSTFWTGWHELDPRFTRHAESLSLLFFPAAVFVAIFRYGLFDVENLVRRSLVYGVIAGLVLLFMYVLLTTALPLLAIVVDHQVALWLITALALVTGILFRPIRSGIEQLVESGLFPERRALRQQLIQIAGTLPELDDPSELVQRLADQTRQALRLKWAAVVIVDGPDRLLQGAASEGLDAEFQTRLIGLLDTRSPTFTLLSRRKRPLTVRRLGRRQPAAGLALSTLGAEVLIPLFFQRRMIGILCLASKQSGELFLREELELLDLFSHQIATNFENLRLFQDATYERLTGLLRREAVLQQLELESRRAADAGTPLSVLMIDLDHFKSINDAHGHLFGDRILEQVATTMQQQVRAVDALGRYGGEEFLLILPDTGQAGARVAADKLRQAVAGLEFETLDRQHRVQVTISIGAACHDGGLAVPAPLARTLLEKADQAVYEAKHEGRNCLVVHGPLGQPASA